MKQKQPQEQKTKPERSPHRRKRLMEIYHRLKERYGPQHWWPGDGPFEIAMGAILTQATNWGNVEKAIASLKEARVVSPRALRDVPEQELARLIYSSGFFNAKARKLKAFVRFLGERFRDDLEAMKSQDLDSLREALLSIHGIGEETADDILLYVAEKPSFVIDAYTRRIAERLVLAPATRSYEALRRLFMDNLPHDSTLFNEYHALLVKHGKYVCKKTPLCMGCCLLEVCPTGRDIVKD